MEKLNVAIADDNEKMVEILGRMIEEDKDLTLVGKAHNGELSARSYAQENAGVYRRISGWTGTDHRGRFQPWRRILYAEAF